MLRKIKAQAKKKFSYKIVLHISTKCIRSQGWRLRQRNGFLIKKIYNVGVNKVQEYVITKILLKANHKKRSSVCIIDFQQLLNSFMTEAVII